MFNDSELYYILNAICNDVDLTRKQLKDLKQSTSDKQEIIDLSYQLSDLLKIEVKIRDKLGLDMYLR